MTLPPPTPLSAARPGGVSIAPKTVVSPTVDPDAPHPDQVRAALALPLSADADLDAATQLLSDAHAALQHQLSDVSS